LLIFKNRFLKANTLANGTTTAMYFATLHKAASLKLAEIAHNMGQRAFVGKISMDSNSPDYYVEDTKSAVTEAEDFITSLQSKNVLKTIFLLSPWIKMFNFSFALKYPLVQPVITPRFAITCSMELMKKLGDLAQQYDISIQVIFV